MTDFPICNGIVTLKKYPRSVANRSSFFHRGRYVHPLLRCLHFKDLLGDYREESVGLLPRTLAEPCVAPGPDRKQYLTRRHGARLNRKRSEWSESNCCRGGNETAVHGDYERIGILRHHVYPGRHL